MVLALPDPLKMKLRAPKYRRTFLLLHNCARHNPISQFAARQRRVPAKPSNKYFQFGVSSISSSTMETRKAPMFVWQPGREILTEAGGGLQPFLLSPCSMVRRGLCFLLPHKPSDASRPPDQRTRLPPPRGHSRVLSMKPQFRRARCGNRVAL